MVGTAIWGSGQVRIIEYSKIAMLPCRDVVIRRDIRSRSTWAVELTVTKFWVRQRLTRENVLNSKEAGFVVICTNQEGFLDELA